MQTNFQVLLQVKCHRLKGLLEMLKATEEAARCGMENTKKYVAKFGRAKSLLERAIGHQDAGATSMYLIYKAMSDYINGN